MESMIYPQKIGKDLMNCPKCSIIAEKFRNLEKNLSRNILNIIN